jgi:hypothetical protein
MPHFGQLPGMALRTSGCIGQLYSAAAGAAGIIGTSAIPHFGHEPAPTCTTSGCIGQVYSTPVRVDAGAAGTPPAYLPGSASNFAAQCLQQK